MSSPPVILPSGTYRYEVRDGNEITVSSRITVKRDGGAVVVLEDANLGSENVKVERRLDPRTYSVVTYSAPGQNNSAITIDGNRATFTDNRGTRTILKGAPGLPSTVFDFVASSFALVPAMIAVTGAKSYNEYAFYGRPTVGRVTVVPPSGARPAGVPSTDVSIGLRENDSGEKSATLWYDPRTCVLDAMRIGNDVGFVRLR